MVYQSRPAASPESSTGRMCGWSRRAAIRISRRKRSGPSVAGELGMQHLEGDVAVVLEVVGEVDRGHAAAPELPLDAVTACPRVVAVLPRVIRC